jgi:putative heme degradation protein
VFVAGFESVGEVEAVADEDDSVHNQAGFLQL